MTGTMTDVVLVHSTGQGAAGWARVVDALAARGYNAHALDLPNDRPELRTDDYAELVGDRFGRLPSPVVVAHSGSGVLLPALARRLGAARQVWLAAWVPDGTTSFGADARAHLAEAFEPDWVGANPADDDVAARLLFHDCDSVTLAWALGTRREFLPDAAFDERVELAREIPSTYILATEDRTILPGWQRRLARERLGVEPIEIASGHCPNVSQPDRLAELLADAAGA